MKAKTVLTSLALSSVLSVVTLAHASTEITFRYAEATPNRGARAQAMQYFADQLNEKSGGGLNIEFHWGGSLLKASAILGGVSAGTTELGTTWAAYSPQEMRALSVGDIPVPEADPWVGMRAMYDLMTTNKDLQRAFDANDVVYITNFTTSQMQLECAGDVRIRSLDDLNGKKVRASAIYGKILNEVGANLVNFTYSEIYQALDSGLIDCSGGYLYAMRAFKTAEVSTSVALVNWGQIAGMGMVMNKWVWDDLSDDQKRLFRQIGSDMVNYYAEHLIKENEDVLSKLPTGEIGNSIEVIRWTEEERKKLFEHSEKYVRAWIKDMNEAGFDGQAIWDEYNVLLKKYQTELNEKGYPWQRT
ncbi:MULTISPECIES: C4-dicarboxylate TRAP transporter substrate-binding protein [Marinobacter]|uniref:ABC transporter substrate-binding protein n=1 Tax=Marinobacter profundi TaxID=2666256 RepID=A0A2G1UN84_9GAMM|nr:MULTISPECIES: C4-dicarboxylate TRAP transporter substrate-binding protein [Marinobacter]MBD3655033.1 C4-dicarboxylate TRAP transporter substrate-binding protein [Marinobacter sp.]PHQ15948.1 ABC transporter substrate-binding protein [Marinobacter profundi]